MALANDFPEREPFCNVARAEPDSAGTPPQQGVDRFLNEFGHSLSNQTSCSLTSTPYVRRELTWT